MKRQLQWMLPLGKLLLYWFLLFDAMRLGFIALNVSKFEGSSFWEITQAFIYSIHLDLASIAYLGGIGVLLMVIGLIWNQPAWFKVARIYTILISIPIVFIHVGEAVAYGEWNHKLTSRVFNHLFQPDEVVKTADWTMSIQFLLTSAIFIILAVYLSKRLIHYRAQAEHTTLNKSLRTVVLFPLSALLLFTSARGGLQQIPINSNAAYYSSNYVLNDLSVNSTYFFGKSYLLYKRANLDKYLPTPTAEQRALIEELWFNYPLEHDQYIFDSEQPNIVYIILESWSANAIQSVSGLNDCAPYFDQLAQEGLLFDNLYAVSTTSEVGNTAILSGYPAIPEIFISKQPEKARKLPSISRELKSKGYTTQYLFSGDLKYGNIESYLTDQGFDLVEDELDFPSNLPKGKLNYSDEALFELGTARLDNAKQPFLQCFFTGSTHSPYDFPGHENYKMYDGPEGKFMNSIRYSDSVVYHFLRKMEKKPWFDNTIFVLIADHGHAVNGIQNPSATPFFRVPCLIWGKPLKAAYRGQRVNKLGSQADVVRTLSYQLKGDHASYRWSKDLLNPNAPEYAVHAIARGYGFVNRAGNFSQEILTDIDVENTFQPQDFKKYASYSRYLLSMIYEEYKGL